MQVQGQQLLMAAARVQPGRQGMPGSKSHSMLCVSYPCQCTANPAHLRHHALADGDELLEPAGVSLHSSLVISRAGVAAIWHPGRLMTVQPLQRAELPLRASCGNLKQPGSLSTESEWLQDPHPRRLGWGVQATAHEGHILVLVGAEHRRIDVGVLQDLEHHAAEARVPVLAASLLSHLQIHLHPRLMLEHAIIRPRTRKQVKLACWPGDISAGGACCSLAVLPCAGSVGGSLESKRDDTLCRSLKALSQQQAFFVFICLSVLGPLTAQ